MHASDTYTLAVADAIIMQIADGIPLREICRQPGMPPWQTVYAWRKRLPEFDERFAPARELGFEAIFEDALRIADTQEVGITTTTKPTGVEVTRKDMLEHRKLRIETRLKLLAKWDPKRYGDKQTIEHIVEDQSVQRLLEGVKRTGG